VKVVIDGLARWRLLELHGVGGHMHALYPLDRLAPPLGGAWYSLEWVHLDRLRPLHGVALNWREVGSSGTVHGAVHGTRLKVVVELIGSHRIWSLRLDISSLEAGGRVH